MAKEENKYENERHFERSDKSRVLLSD